MGIDALGYLLGLLTVGMSFIAVKQRNILIYLATSILWASLVAFILANTVAGANWQVMFLLAAFTFIVAMLLLTAVSRRTGVTIGGEKTEGVVGEAEGAKTNLNVNMRGLRKNLLDMSDDEYRSYIRRSLHPNRRRR